MPAVPDLDLARIRKFCEDQTPVEFRDEMRVEADVRGRSVTILECRPPWHPELTDWSRQPLAQMRFDPDTNLWSLYWADRNSRWHRYDDLDPGPVDELLRRSPTTRPASSGAERRRQRDAGPMALDEWERRTLRESGAEERVRSIEAELREATPIRELTRSEFNELFRDAPPPTVDDVSITVDGRRLDSREAVLAFIAELDAERAKDGRADDDPS